MSPLIALILSAIVVVIDQALKYWVELSLKPIGTTPFLSGVLDFTYVENYGAAYGIFQNQKWFLIVATSILLFCLVYLLWKKRIQGNILVLSTALIIGGGVGNLVDRIFRGYVVDYLDINAWLSFPVFNFADCCVVCGTALFILYILFLEEKERKKKDV